MKKKYESYRPCLNTSFWSLAFSTFSVSLPYFCTICILYTQNLILMVGEVNFYFVVTITITTTCTENNEKALGKTHLTQSWKYEGKIRRETKKRKEQNWDEIGREKKWRRWRRQCFAQQSQHFHYTPYNHVLKWWNCT